jgi:hypothetical protein
VKFLWESIYQWHDFDGLFMEINGWMCFFCKIKNLKEKKRKNENIFFEFLAFFVTGLVLI